MFDDTLSAELPEHEDWIYNVAIPRLEKDWEVKTKIVKADKTYCGYFYQKYKKGNRAGQIHGFPMLLGSWCNNILKIDPIKKYKNSVGKSSEIIGIAVDEPNRMKSKRNSPDTILPLVKCGVTQAQSFEIAKGAGLLSPAYNKGRTRLGCWFCHNQRIDALRRLRKEYPELWDRLLQLDKDSLFSFTPRASVHDFDKRFALENCQLTLV